MLYLSTYSLVNTHIGATPISFWFGTAYVLPSILAPSQNLSSITDFISLPLVSNNSSISKKAPFLAFSKYGLAHEQVNAKSYGSPEFIITPIF